MTLRGIIRNKRSNTVTLSGAAVEIDDFHQILDASRGYSLNLEQRQAVDHPDDVGSFDQTSRPLWLLAGPGSGKTEVLIARALKLICVNNIPASSVFLTTFTKKASRNLEDRLAANLTALQAVDVSLRQIDPADIWLGTLHSLCNEVLQEHRYPGYQNVRLLDDVEQALFLYKRGEATRHDDLAFWQFFEYAVPNWRSNSAFPPSKWKRVSAAITLFNHLVEDCVVLDRLQAAGSHWATLASLYEQYRSALTEHHRCDYAHLQTHFLNFLHSPSGSRFLNGDGEQPPLLYLLVDEYQDTNPIQEQIYLTLAQRAPHNITVVGDDDQALYRFRGGTVSCMVHFNLASELVLGVTPRRIQLAHNYRSHADVVTFFNAYIESHPEMQVLGVRAPEKLPVQPASQISGAYPAVSWINRLRAGDLGNAVADFIQLHLQADGIISDLNQCVLLMRSTQDSPRKAAPYLRALEARGIPVYNPRSKSFMDSQEVQCLMAVLIEVLDPARTYRSNLLRDLPATIDSWHAALAQAGVDGQATASSTSYIQRCGEEIPRMCNDHPGGFLGVSILEIIYRILSLEPFRDWRQNPERDSRLSKVTRLFEGYHSMDLDHLRANSLGTDLDQGFRNQFFNMLVGYLIDAGVNDDEEEDVIAPAGMLPVMTIHQAKGLEFPFVFVAQLGRGFPPGASQILDQELRPFRLDLYPKPIRTPQELAIEDDIRLWYVAYSRAQYALILIGTPA